jgi:uncharacterized protein
MSGFGSVSITDGGIPVPVFAALAGGRGGPVAIRRLAAIRYRKIALLLRGVLEVALDGAPGRARLARQGYELLAEVQSRHPAAARQAIMYPSAGGWALRVVRAHHSRQQLTDADPGRLTALAAAAAIRAGFAADIEVPVNRGRVALPSLGVADIGESRARVHVTAAGATVIGADRTVQIPDDPYQDGPGWHGLHLVRSGSLGVVVDDVDPFRLPSSADLAPRLTVRERTSLADMLGQAWPIITAVHPDVAAELQAAVTVIVPLTNTRGGQVSSSSSATFGAVGISQPPDPYTCAVTLAHELQHLKLSALLDIAAMIEPDGDQLFYAPWRDDPRPLSGLLQGAYAFLGVSSFWRTQRHYVADDVRLRADTEFARWRTAAMLVVDTLLASRRLTPAGEVFVGEMAKTLLPWQAEDVLESALQRAQADAAAHLADWQLANGPRPA